MERNEIYISAVCVVYAIVGMYGKGYILYRFAKPFMERNHIAVARQLSGMPAASILF